MKALNTSPTAKHSSWAYAEQHLSDDPVLQATRELAFDLGVEPVSEGTAATLTVLAAAVQAKTLVEVGTGVGVSGISLLRGAQPEAILTSIDLDPEHLHAARTAFRQEQLPARRTRLITGRAEEVLPRLATGSYDLVLLDAGAEHLPDFTAESFRMLAPGGLLIINDALDQDQVPRPAVREESTQTMRETERVLREDGRVTTTLLGTGTGLLVAVRR